MQHNIPTELLDLIQEKSFSSLLPNEKALVLKYMSETEYIELHHSYEMTQDYFQETPIIAPSEKILTQLQAAFPSQKPQPTFLSQQIPLWQAAAAIVLLLCAWSIQSFYKSSPLPIEKLVYVSVHDTLKMTEYIVQRDTLLLPKAEMVKNKRKAVDNPVKYVIKAQPIPTIREPEKLPQNLDSDIYTLTAVGVEKALQNRSGTNRKEDSLYKKFGFVSM